LRVMDAYHALRGQGFSAAIDANVMVDGGAVPGTCGPHMAFERGAGIGGVPLLRHIFVPIWRLLQVFQPHVLILYVSISATVIPYEAAREAQKSPDLTAYA